MIRDLAYQTVFIAAFGTAGAAPLWANIIATWLAALPVLPAVAGGVLLGLPMHNPV